MAEFCASGLRFTCQLIVLNVKVSPPIFRPFSNVAASVLGRGGFGLVSRWLKIVSSVAERRSRKVVWPSGLRRWI